MSTRQAIPSYNALNQEIEIAENQNSDIYKAATFGILSANVTALYQGGRRICPWYK
jgi:hypothetical protein